MDAVVKLVTVAFFAALLYFMIDFLIDKFASMLSVNSFSVTAQYFICQFGILQAINIFVSLFIASWFSEKILRYLS